MEEKNHAIAMPKKEHEEMHITNYIQVVEGSQMYFKWYVDTIIKERDELKQQLQASYSNKLLLQYNKQIGELLKQLSKAEAIIKEAREYINNHDMDDGAHRAALDYIFDKDNND